MTEKLRNSIVSYLIENPLNREEKGCYLTVANKFKVDSEQIRSIYRSLRAKGLVEEGTISLVTNNTITETSYDNTKDEGKITASLIREPKNDEDIIKLLKIDTSKYILTHYWSKFNGKNWAVSAFVKRKTTKNSLEKQKEIIINELCKYSKPSKIKRNSLKNNEKDSLLLVSLPDVHFGKLANEEETGEDYDISIAEERFKTAVYELLDRTNLSKIERVLFPVGNDLINIDSKRNMTTAGTPQDCDTRYFKIIKTVRRVLIEVIDELSEIAPVDVVFVPGNHDEQSVLLLGEVIDAYYYNNEEITVYNSPKLRKYYKYGLNSWQFTHGNEEKHSDLGLIFATEEPELWAATKYRFCQLGHFHKSKKTDYVSVDEHQGFQIQILPSLSGADFWHKKRGYDSNKAAKAFLYHNTKGLIAEYTHTI